MARRSPRKKAASSKTIVESDDDNFMVVASDDRFAVSSSCSIFFFWFLFYFIVYSLDERDIEDQHINDESISRQNGNHGKRNAKLSPKHRVTFRKNRSPTPVVELDEDDDE